MPPPAPANVRVLVRIRPLNRSELNSRGSIGRSSVITIDNSFSGKIDFKNGDDGKRHSAVGGTISVNSSTVEDSSNARRRQMGIDSGRLSGYTSDGDSVSTGNTSASVSRQFTFDAVHGARSTQTEVFDSVKGIVDAVAAGYNGTIVAYGQTGSGKTHTVFGSGEGDESGAGLVQRSLRALFHKITLSQAKAAADDCLDNGPEDDEIKESGTIKTTYHASFFEIFNERVYDLLSTESLETALPVRENVSGVYVEGLKEIQVTKTSEAEDLLMKGMDNRHVAATSMNRTSSRSHAVFVLSVKSVHTSNDGLQKVRTSKFTLVDLAGSERQKSTDTFGERLKEASMINKSLLCLGHVINALVDREAGRDRHVPFRNSKLTFLLRDSWGGNSKTCLVATVSPSAASLAETISTLKFAQRAKLIKNNAVLNEDTCGTVAALQAEVAKLKSQLKDSSVEASLIDSTVCPTTRSSTGSLPDGRRDIIASVKRRAHRAEEKVAALEKQVAEEKEIVHTLKRKLQEETMVRKFKERRLTFLQGKNRVMDENDHISLLTSEIESLKQQIETPSTDAIEWRVAYEEIKEELDNKVHKEDSELLELELSKLDETVEKLYNEKILLQERVSELTRSSSETQDEIDSILKEVDRLEKEMFSLQDKLKDANRLKFDANKRATEAEEDLKMLQSQLFASKQESFKASEDFGHLQKISDQLSNEVKNLKSELETKNSRLAEMESMSNEIENKLQSTVNELTANVEQFSEKVTNLEASKKNLQQQLEAKSSENASLVGQVKDAASEVKKQKSVILELEDRINTLQTEKDILMDRFVKDKSRTENILQEQIEKLETNNTAMAQEVKRLEEEAARNLSVIDEKEKNVRNLEGRIGTMEKDNAEALKIVESKINKLELEKKCILEQVGSWKAEIEEGKRHASYVEKQKVLVNDMKTRLECMEREKIELLQLAREEKEKLEEALQNDANVLKAAMKSHSEEKADLILELEKNRKKLKEMELKVKEAEDDQEQLQTLQNDKKQFLEERTKLETLIEQNKTESLEAAKELQQQVSIVSTLKDQLACLRAQQDEVITMHESKIRTLENELDSLSKSKTEVDTMLKNLKMKTTEHAKENEHRNSIVLEMETKIVSLQREKDNEIKINVEEKKNLEETHRKIIDALENEVRQLQQETKLLRDKNGALMNETTEKLELEQRKSQKSLQQMESRVISLEENSRILSKEKKESQQIIEKLKANAQVTVTDLSKRDDLVKQLEERYKSLQQTHEVDNARFESRVQTLETDLLLLEKKHKKSIASENATKKDNLLAQDRITLLKREKGSLEFEIDSLREDQDKLNDQVHCLSQRNEMLKEENVKLRNDMEKMKQRHLELAKSHENTRKTPLLSSKKSRSSMSSTAKNFLRAAIAPNPAPMAAQKDFAPPFGDELSARMDNMLQRMSTTSEEDPATATVDDSFDESMFLPNFGGEEAADDEKENNPAEVFSSESFSTPHKSSATPFKTDYGSARKPLSEKKGNASQSKKSEKKNREKKIGRFSSRKERPSWMLFDNSKMFDKNM